MSYLKLKYLFIMVYLFTGMALLAQQVNNNTPQIEKVTLNQSLAMNEKNELVAEFEVTFRNVSDFKVAETEISIEGKKLKKTSIAIQSSSIPESIRIPVNYKDLLKNAAEDTILQIVADWKSGRTASQLTITQKNLVELCFNPIQLPAMATPEFEIPKDLEKAPLAIGCSTAKEMIRINGKDIQALAAQPQALAKTGFTWFLPSQNDKKLILQTDDGNPDIHFSLVVYEPLWYSIRTGLNLKDLTSDANFISERAFYSQVFQYISKKKWEQLHSYFQAQENKIGELSAALQQNSIYVSSLAEFDLGTLWFTRDSYEKHIPILEKILGMQNANPAPVYVNGQTRFYAWLEKSHPTLFARIQENVKAGKWIPSNGLWSTPDFDHVGGEAIIRQFLYGHEFCHEKFNIHPQVMWLTGDAFLPPMIPQIFRKSAIQNCIIPADARLTAQAAPTFLFNWQAPDGSQVLTIDASSSNRKLTNEQVIDSFRNFQNQTQKSDFLLALTPETVDSSVINSLVSAIDMMRQQTVFPKTEFTSPKTFFNKITEHAADIPSIQTSIHTGNHQPPFARPFELIRTNRQIENLLETVEKFVCMAEIPYPKAQLNQAWKRILINQAPEVMHHTDDPEIFRRATAAYDTTRKEAEILIQSAINSVKKKVDTQGWGTPFIVFNPMPCGREGIAVVDLPQELWGKNLRVSDADQWVVKSQPIGRKKLLFEVTQEQSTPLPANGYRVFHIQTGRNHKVQDAVQVASNSLKNKFFDISFNPETGGISSIKDIVNNRDVLMAPGNEPEFLPLNSPGDSSWQKFAAIPVIEIGEKGPIRGSIRITRSTGKSKIIQEIYIYRNVPTIDFRTEVDWQDKDARIRVKFPVTVKNDTATFEVPFGWVKRPTETPVSENSDMIEMPSHKWVDLTDTDDSYGVSLFDDNYNDFSVRNNTLEIDFLGSSSKTNTTAQKYKNTFTYILYPHAGDWKAAGTHKYASELNYPLEIQMIRKKSGSWAKSYSFVNLNDEAGVRILSVKPAEKSEGTIVRLLEYFGESHAVKINFAKPVASLQEVNLLEEAEGKSVTVSDKTAEINIKPFEIKTFEVKFE